MLSEHNILPLDGKINEFENCVEFYRIFNLASSSIGILQKNKETKQGNLNMKETILIKSKNWNFKFDTGLL